MKRRGRDQYDDVMLTGGKLIGGVTNGDVWSGIFAHPTAPHHTTHTTLHPTFPYHPHLPTARRSPPACILWQRRLQQRFFSNSGNKGWADGACLPRTVAVNFRTAAAPAASPAAYCATHPFPSRRSSHIPLCYRAARGGTCACRACTLCAPTALPCRHAYPPSL